MELWRAVAAAIARATGKPFSLASERQVAGGDTNQAFRIRGRDDTSYFVKVNDAERVEMFVAESEGLRELAQARAVRVPQPVCVGRAAGRAYLVLEFLHLGAASERRMAALGDCLARLHRVTRDAFGWHLDNTLGTAVQPNAPGLDWTAFWRDQRLRHQIDLGRTNGLPASLLEKAERLAADLDRLLGSHHPAASLLHGDLWHGNTGFLASGEPVLFDPAVYFGDRESDIAMTELFGLFPASFYTAYQARWPLDAGYPVRRPLYQAYQLLNHANLFGAAYFERCARVVDAALAGAG